MAGAMRKMGIYLGLVEDDDARAYARYDARQADHHDRYDDGRYDDRYDEGRYDDHRPGRHESRYEDRLDDRPDDRLDDRLDDRHGSRYGAEARDAAGYGGYDSMTGDRGYDDRRFGDRSFDDERAEPRAGGPEPALPRRAGATRLGLATPPSPVSSLSPGSPVSSVPGPVSASGELRTSPTTGAGGPRLGTLGGTVGGTVGGTAGLTAGGTVGAGLAAREAVATAEAAPAPSAPQPYRITTLSPKTYNEARAIGEAFREGSPVIMNLTELDHADARRLVDFAAGLIFGLRGNIEPVTAKVFLLSPRDVDVTAEDKARIREGGFFAQS
jgi:cell division inhibitor SepF